MTPKLALKQSGSNQTQTPTQTVADAIRLHREKEAVSFHTPGHKGRGPNFYSNDLTELPGLDELANSQGILAACQTLAATTFGAARSFLSVNGASAAVLAAIIACASLGKKIALPRNCHRSAINGLVLSGMEPLWYETGWDADWQLWGQTDVKTIETLLQQHKDLTALMIVSPTYSGHVSDIESIAKLCHRHNVVLIVDEAHGSHFMPSSDCGLPLNAVTTGADIAIASLHKTLGALTQCGLLHVGASFESKSALLQGALNLVQSSSPSYLLIASIEEAITQSKSVAQMIALAKAVRQTIAGSTDLELLQADNLDPAHIVVRSKTMDAQSLYERFCVAGIYPEAIVGNAVLLLIGIGSTAQDAETLKAALPTLTEGHADRATRHQQIRPIAHQRQEMSPRQAALAASELVPAERAVGRLAADCFAPCPPGLPVLVPGQRITKEALSLCLTPHMRVVIESTDGGGNATSTKGEE